MNEMIYNIVMALFIWETLKAMVGIVLMMIITILKEYLGSKDD